MSHRSKQKALRALKLLSITFASLVLVVFLFLAGLAYWVLMYPQSAWNFASRYFLPADLKVTWEEIDFHWQKQTWTEWGFQWTTKNLVVTKGDPQIDIGVVNADAKWTIHLFSDKPTFDFERLVVQTREKSFFQVMPSQEPSVEQSLFQMAKEYLGYISDTNHLAAIRVIQIEVKDFEVRIPESAPWLFSGRVFKNHESAKDQNIDFDLDVSSLPLQVKTSGFLNGSAMETNDSFLQANIDVKSDGWKVTGAVTGVYRNDQLVVTTKPNITVGDSKKPITVNPDAHITLSESALDLKTQLQIAGLPGPIVRIDDLKAEARVPLENNVLWVEKPSTLNATTMIDLFLIDKDMRRPLEKACRCSLPEKFKVSLNGKAWLNALFGTQPKRAKVADARIEIESVKNKLFSADAAGGISIFKEQGNWQFEPRLDAKVIVFSFQGLRQFLDAKGIIIPAPLDILDGTIHFTANSPVDRDEKTLHTSVQVETDLSSPTQRVVADAEVILKLANTFKALDVDMDAVVRTLKLDLPPLEPVLGIPALSADSRILRVAPKPATSNFKVHVLTRVRTEKPGAIQLASKYAKPYVPVTVDVNARDAKTAGSIKVEPFTIDYLRRKLFVENIILSLTQNEDEDFPLVGRIRVEQGGYKIFIDLAGTLQSPSIKLTSDSNLSKDDIISVLLYGRVSSQLVSGEAENAGNVNAALADRAVGLFGLWAFASTPIQSFSYNATTKVYTATVDIGGGVTAGVGTNWEQATNLELRKRVSRRWVLTATWAPNQYNRQEGRLVLQWEKRF